MIEIIFRLFWGIIGSTAFLIFLILAGIATAYAFLTISGALR